MLNPLEAEQSAVMQAATNRIASFLSASGQAAASANGGSSSISNTGTTSNLQQQQQQQPNQALPVTFTHSTFSSSDAGRRLLLQPVAAAPGPVHAVRCSGVLSQHRKIVHAVLSIA